MGRGTRDLGIWLRVGREFLIAGTGGAHTGGEAKAGCALAFELEDDDLAGVDDAEATSLVRLALAALPAILASGGPFAFRFLVRASSVITSVDTGRKQPLSSADPGALSASRLLAACLLSWALTEETAAGDAGA